MSESTSTSAATAATTTPAGAAAGASQISRQDLILLVQKLQKRAATAEQTVTSLKTKLESAQAEIAAAKAAAVTTAATSTPAAAPAPTIDPVKEQLIKDQQQQIEKLTQQCATLQAAATAASPASTPASFPSSTDTTLIQSFEQQIEQHKTELCSLRVQFQRIESERDATVAKLTQQHNTELQATLNNVQDLKREREQLRREMESLKTTPATTTPSSPAEAPKATSPSPDMESFHQLQASNAKLNAAILELENNNTKLAETLMKKKAQIKALEKEYNEFKEKTKADLAAVEAKATAADQRLVKTFQLLTTEKNTVKEQNEAMEELRRTLTRTQSDAAELIQQQQAVMIQSQKTIEQLQHDYNTLKQELIRREENEDTNIDHQRELQRKIEENREILSELEHERMVRERERLQRDRDAAMDKEERERMLDEFEREKLRLTREHNESITAAETKIKQLLAKVKAGAKKLKEMTAEETELKAKLEGAEAATAACRTEITSLHSEHTRLTTDFESEKLSINTRHNERYEKLLRELKTVKDNNNKTINEQAIRLQEVTAQVMKLEEEIATGKPSERRIFELANLQARREEQVQRSQMEMSQLKAKNKEYKSKLRMVLDERDFLSDQVKQLTKSRSRAQVNLDYLKSIMVRFISFENRHPQRRALIPVIATILQFTEEDLKTIQESSGAGEQSGWLSKMSGGWLGTAEAPVAHLPTSNSLPLHLTVSSTVNLDPVVPDHGVNDLIAKSDAVGRQLQLELIADEAKNVHSQHSSRQGSNPNSRPFTPLATDNYSPLSSPNSIPSSASSYSRRLQASNSTQNTNNNNHHTFSSANKHSHPHAIHSSSSSPFTFTTTSITSTSSAAPSSQPHSSYPNGNGDTHSQSQPHPVSASVPTSAPAPTAAARSSDVDDLFGAVEVEQ